MRIPLINVHNWVRGLRAVLTDTRAARLDNLDAMVSSRLSEVSATQNFDAAEMLIRTRAARLKVVIINAIGIGNFTVPNDVYLLWVSICSSGTGGVSVGGTNASDSKQACPGCSGASLICAPMIVTPGQVIPYKVGKGGAYLRLTSSGFNVPAGVGEESFFGNYTCPAATAPPRVTYETSNYVSATAGSPATFSSPAGYVTSGTASNTFSRKRFSASAAAVFCVDGIAGIVNESSHPATPLSFLNNAGLGGIGQINGNTHVLSNGGDGVIMLEMESAL